MKLARGASSEDRNKIIAVAVFVAIAGAVAYYEVFGGSTPAPTTPAAPVVTTVPVAATGGPATVAVTGASAAKLTTAALDPTLHMDAMLVSESVEYSGSGRNIFSASSAPPPQAKTVIPTPVVGPRPQQVTQPVIAAPQGPPPPPPIQLKFFGIETTADGTRRAFLLHGDDVIIASAGDVVVRRYRVVSITSGSIEVEDMQYNDKQTLPLLTN